MQGTQYATKRSILCRGAFCGPTARNYYVRSLVGTIVRFEVGLYTFSYMYLMEYKLYPCADRGTFIKSSTYITEGGGQWLFQRKLLFSRIPKGIKHFPGWESNCLFL